MITVLSTKIGVIETKMLGVTGPKTNYNAKLSDVVSKYFTYSNYKNFTKEILDRRIKN